MAQEGDATGERRESRGRELALACLCHVEGFAAPERAAALGLLAALTSDAAVRRFAVDLVELVVAAWPEIDAAIADTSKRWRLERMDRVDRNAIRIVTAELLHRPQTPRAVILSEAVRLAARYGGERSPTFVNGVARALADALRPAVESPSPPSPPNPPSTEDPA
jgi:N utilization substance protein B